MGEKTTLRTLDFGSRSDSERVRPFFVTFGLFANSVPVEQIFLRLLRLFAAKIPASECPNYDSAKAQRREERPITEGPGRKAKGIRSKTELEREFFS